MKITKTIEEKTEDRIKAGIAFLNVVKPDWFKKVNTKRLNMSKSYTCLIGEVFGDYDGGIRELSLYDEDDDSVPEALGFYETLDSNYPLLTKLWKKAVLKLKK